MILSKLWASPMTKVFIPSGSFQGEMGGGGTGEEGEDWKLSYGVDKMGHWEFFLLWVQKGTGSDTKMV